MLMTEGPFRTWRRPVSASSGPAAVAERRRHIAIEKFSKALPKGWRARGEAISAYEDVFHVEFGDDRGAPIEWVFLSPAEGGALTPAAGLPALAHF